MKPSEVLDGAANILLRDGWLQGAYYASPSLAGGDRSEEEYERLRLVDLEANRSAPCCQAGAISRAAYGYAWLVADAGPPTLGASEARSKADFYMSQHLKRALGVNSPICWNDDSGRTVDEVVAALRGAAESARAAGE